MNGEVFLGLALYVVLFYILLSYVWAGCERLYRWVKKDLRELDEARMLDQQRAVARSRSGARADRILADEIQRREKHRRRSSSIEVDDEHCDALAAKMEA